jgi:hypothetical protein
MTPLNASKGRLPSFRTLPPLFRFEQLPTGSSRPPNGQLTRLILCRLVSVRRLKLRADHPARHPAPTAMARLDCRVVRILAAFLVRAFPAVLLALSARFAPGRTYSSRSTGRKERSTVVADRLQVPFSL